MMYIWSTIPFCSSKIQKSLKTQFKLNAKTILMAKADLNYHEAIYSVK